MPIDFGLVETKDEGPKIEPSWQRSERRCRQIWLVSMASVSERTLSEGRAGRARQGSRHPAASPSSNPDRPTAPRSGWEPACKPEAPAAKRTADSAQPAFSERFLEVRQELLQIGPEPACPIPPSAPRAKAPSGSARSCRTIPGRSASSERMCLPTSTISATVCAKHRAPRSSWVVGRGPRLESARSGKSMSCTTAVRATGRRSRRFGKAGRRRESPGHEVRERCAR